LHQSKHIFIIKRGVEIEEDIGTYLDIRTCNRLAFLHADLWSPSDSAYPSDSVASPAETQCLNIRSCNLKIKTHKIEKKKKKKKKKKQKKNKVKSRTLLG